MVTGVHPQKKERKEKGEKNGGGGKERLRGHARGARKTRQGDRVACGLGGTGRRDLVSCSWCVRYRDRMSVEWKGKEEVSSRVSYFVFWDSGWGCRGVRQSKGVAERAGDGGRKEGRGGKGERGEEEENADLVTTTIGWAASRSVRRREAALAALTVRDRNHRRLL